MATSRLTPTAEDVEVTNEFSRNGTGLIVSLKGPMQSKIRQFLAMQVKIVARSLHCSVYLALPSL